MYRQDLLIELEKFTLLARMAAEGEIGLREFAQRYGNFYYAYALDGHEAGPEEKAVLEKVEDEVELHRRLQTEVVDLLCFSEGKELETYLSAGRITPTEGKARLDEIVGRFMAGGQGP